MTKDNCGERFTGHGLEWRPANLSPTDAQLATQGVEQRGGLCVGERLAQELEILRTQPCGFAAALQGVEIAVEGTDEVHHRIGPGDDGG